MKKVCIAVIFLVLAFFVLKWLFIPKSQDQELNISYFKDEYKKLGAMSYEYKTVGIIFSLTALLWFTRQGHCQIFCQSKKF